MKRTLSRDDPIMDTKEEQETLNPPSIPFSTQEMDELLLLHNELCPLDSSLPISEQTEPPLEANYEKEILQMGMDGDYFRIIQHNDVLIEKITTLELEVQRLRTRNSIQNCEIKLYNLIADKERNQQAIYSQKVIDGHFLKIKFAALKEKLDVVEKALCRSHQDRSDLRNKLKAKEEVYSIYEEFFVQNVKSDFRVEFESLILKKEIVQDEIMSLQNKYSEYYKELEQQNKDFRASIRSFLEKEISNYRAQIQKQFEDVSDYIRIVSERKQVPSNWMRIVESHSNIILSKIDKIKIE